MKLNAAEYLFEKALLALKDRQHDKALDCLATCLKANPEMAEAWMIRGNIEHAEGRHLNALLHHDRAVAIAPTKFDAWCNRGIAFCDLGLFASARACFERSIELCDAYEPRMNMANMYCHLMDLPAAETQYRAALKCQQTDLEGHIQLGLTLLGQGRWKEAWPEYEIRLINTPHPPREATRWPLWRGQDLHGQTILLYPEQGLGDEILFQRFAHELKQRHAGVRVIVEARPELYRAAQHLIGPDRVIVQHDEPNEPIDYQCALMDTAMVLGTEPDAIPMSGGYYRGLPWMRLPKDKFNVGLCWQSGRRRLQPEVEASFKNKSVPLEWFAPLRQPGVQLYSLQRSHDDDKVMRQFGMIDLMDDCYDLADTAALMGGLDLIISVDTAVAHLAGAMALPVWNFVRFSGYWPWMGAQRKTAWYDSMTLYRQPAIGDWEKPIDQATADLSKLLEKREAA